MNIPGVPGISGGSGGGDTAGMSNQEAAMVKAVCSLRLIWVPMDPADIEIADASRHGELSSEERHIWWNGLCPWGHVWAIHVERMNLLRIFIAASELPAH